MMPKMIAATPRITSIHQRRARVSAFTSTALGSLAMIRASTILVVQDQAIVASAMAGKHGKDVTERALSCGARPRVMPSRRHFLAPCQGSRSVGRRSVHAERVRSKFLVGASARSGAPRDHTEVPGPGTRSFPRRIGADGGQPRPPEFMRILPQQFT